MLTYKRCNETATTKAFTNVYKDDALIGYYLKNTSFAAEQNQNFDFVSYDTDYPSFYAVSVRAIKKRLEEFKPAQFNNALLALNNLLIVVNETKINDLK